MLLRSSTPTQSLDQSPSAALRPLHRKRKADSQPENNERLSKRLSLLNLGMSMVPCTAGASQSSIGTNSHPEQNGQKLYVPVENPQRTDAASTTYYPNTTATLYTRAAQAPSASLDDGSMQLDDTKHKVYIYNMDDELSSESEAEPETDKVVFLPDIEKHLRANRIPPHILIAAGPDLEDLAAKQLVLYSVPSSISVPEEQDSVRKAIIEARARVRERQKAEAEAASMRAAMAPGIQGPDMANGMFTGASVGAFPADDPDAMELD